MRGKQRQGAFMCWIQLFTRANETLMKILLSVVTVAGMLAAGLSYAQSGADVVKAKGCLACHALDQKKIGPAYKDVAAKYRADKGAEGKLVAKLKEGKAHPKIAASDAELKAAVGYVLSLK
jgi:cytochrome c